MMKTLHELNRNGTVALLTYYWSLLVVHSDHLDQRVCCVCMSRQ